MNGKRFTREEAINRALECDYKLVLHYYDRGAKIFAGTDELFFNSIDDAEDAAAKYVDSSHPIAEIFNNGELIAKLTQNNHVTNN